MPGRVIAYDGLRRLQEAWTSATEDCDGTPGTLGVGGVAPYWTAYTYDELGNRTSRTDHAGSTVTTTEYVHGADGAGPHQLTEMTETTGGVSVTTGFGWDAAGNQISRTTGGDTGPIWHAEGTWDAEGELVGITGSGGDTVNVFDASGNRLVRIDETGATVFLPGGQEVHATDTTVTASRWYTLAGTTVAVRTGVGLSGVASVVTDAHGTPIATVPATDPTAAVDRLRAEPFGAARAGQDGTVAGRGFLGAPADPTGLVLLGERFYDPTAGVFISVDPELNPGVPAQFNAYVYAGNNPFTWADPTGRMWHRVDDGRYAKPLPATAGVIAPPVKVHKQNAPQVLTPWTPSPTHAAEQQILASAVNGIASLGNAMLQHPDLVVELIAGALFILAGGAGAAGGGAVCVTGVGCPAGVAAVAASVGLIATGGAAVAAGGAGLASHAMSDSRAEIWKNESAAATSADEVADIAVDAPKITFGHGARHLEGTGLSVEEVESTILQRVKTAASQATPETGSFWGRIQIRGTTIEYRAYTLPDGTINVGTYYVP
ncbi:RHS repeat-associated core domain-containing protein [Microbacterium immunditiarum]|uniref:RHS repeat-associated protein n=1 Tax=Microbacterium immunditiarum TaxID=337480 RepID=A0A7Y9KJE2_9MICO|nr:RHS repeat-associated core domain-containing protein [Microbacterium immunditiarum]NYE21562.1 RHS repeat-associated protein [Microbacterium immunditiarum]